MSEARAFIDGRWITEVEAERMDHPHFQPPPAWTVLPPVGISEEDAVQCEHCGTLCDPTNLGCPWCRRPLPCPADGCHCHLRARP